MVVATAQPVRFELTGASITHPVTVSFTVPPTALPDIPSIANGPDVVWLSTYDPQAGRWQPVGSHYDPATRTVSAQVADLSWWVPFSWIWQQSVLLLRQSLSALAAERATPTPCPGVAGVAVKDSGGQDPPVIGCATQSSSDELTVTISNNRGYAMVVPVPTDVHPVPPNYTGYQEFLQTRKDATQKLGGAYLAPTSELSYTMPLHGSPVVFHAAASLKTYLLDVQNTIQKEVLNVMAGGFGSCILDSMANSGAPPVSALPGLLAECTPVIAQLGAVGKFVAIPPAALKSFLEYLGAVAFDAQAIHAVFDLKGDALSNFSSTVQVTRPPLPTPEFYYNSAIDGGGHLFTHSNLPPVMGIDNHNYISTLHLTAWGPDRLTATGVLNQDDCKPDCASGPYSTYPVQVAASDPRHCTVQIDYGPGTRETYVFSKITVRALSGSPFQYLVGDSVFGPICS
jgi:hypothetical protein